MKKNIIERRVETHLHLVELILKKDFPRVKGDQFALRGAGEDGLLKAAKNYNENSETKFSTYAGVLIKNKIRDEIRHQNRAKNLAVQSSQLTQEIDILESVPDRQESCHFEIREELNKLLEIIPERMRETLMLKFGYGETYQNLVDGGKWGSLANLKYYVDKTMSQLRAAAVG